MINFVWVIFHLICIILTYKFVSKDIDVFLYAVLVYAIYNNTLLINLETKIKELKNTVGDKNE